MFLQVSGKTGIKFSDLLPELKQGDLFWHGHDGKGQGRIYYMLFSNLCVRVTSFSISEKGGVTLQMDARTRSPKNLQQDAGSCKFDLVRKGFRVANVNVADLTEQSCLKLWFDEEWQ